MNYDSMDAGQQVDYAVRNGLAALSIRAHPQIGATAQETPLPETLPADQVQGVPSVSVFSPLSHTSNAPQTPGASVIGIGYRDCSLALPIPDAATLGAMVNYDRSCIFEDCHLARPERQSTPPRESCAERRLNNPFINGKSLSQYVKCVRVFDRPHPTPDDFVYELADSISTQTDFFAAQEELGVPPEGVSGRSATEPTTKDAQSATSRGTDETGTRRSARRTSRKSAEPSGVPMPGLLGLPVVERELRARTNRLSRREETQDG